VRYIGKINFWDSWRRWTARGEAAAVDFEDGFHHVGDVLGPFLRLGEPIQPRRGRRLQGKSELGSVFLLLEGARK